MCIFWVGLKESKDRLSSDPKVVVRSILLNAMGLVVLILIVVVAVAVSVSVSVSVGLHERHENKRTGQTIQQWQAIAISIELKTEMKVEVEMKVEMEIVFLAYWICNGSLESCLVCSFWILQVSTQQRRVTARLMMQGEALVYPWALHGL